MRKITANTLALNARRHVASTGEYISRASLVAGNVPANIITAITPIPIDNI
jgi:hypothetical protein